MTEIGLAGIGHNRGFRPWREEKPKPLQLSEAAPSILDISPAELKRRRQKEAAEYMQRGRRARSSASSTLAASPRDSHKRMNVCGQSRCLLGTADDFTTVAPHDDLANHLYIADDPDLRLGGMQDYLSLSEEDFNQDLLDFGGPGYAMMMAETQAEEEPDEPDVPVTEGICYSTAWGEAQRRRSRHEASLNRKR